jgi:hypothetical protein
MEEWRPILNHENYEISNEGNIRRKSTGIPVKQSLDDREYYCVMLWTNNKQYKNTHFILMIFIFSGHS